MTEPSTLFSQFAALNSDSESVQDSEQSSDETDFIADEFSFMTRSEQFSMAVSCLGLESFEKFEELLELFDIINTLDLAKQVNMALSEPTSMWAMITKFNGHSRETLLSVLNSTENSSETNYFQAAQSQINMVGVASVDYGFHTTLKQTGIQNLDEITKRKRSFLNSAARRKSQLITNAYTALINILPLSAKKSLSHHSLSNQVSEVIKNFDAGNFHYRIDLDVKYPKETGIALAHTLEPKEWIARSVQQFLGHAVAEPILITFKHQATDVSIYDEELGNYLLVSKDESSPYYIERHPSLLFSVDTTSSWKWRRWEHNAMKSVNLSNGDDSVEVKEQLVDSILAEKLDLFKHNNKIDLSFVDTPVPGIGLMDEKLVFSFYKRGYSKLAEVNDNSDYIHIVPVTVAQTLAKSYVRIVLPDCNSVILFDKDLWGKLGHGPNYASSFGFDLTVGDLTSVKNLVLCSQLSLTTAMLKKMSKGEVMDPQVHLDSIKERVLKDKKSNLFSKFVDDYRKQRILEIVFSMTIAGSYGLIVTAARSKVGKRTGDKIDEGSQLHRVVDMFDVKKDNTARQKFDWSSFAPDNPYSDVYSSDDVEHSEQSQSPSIQIVENMLDD